MCVGGFWGRGWHFSLSSYGDDGIVPAMVAVSLSHFLSHELEINNKNLEGKKKDAEDPAVGDLTNQQIQEFAPGPKIARKARPAKCVGCLCS